MVCLVMCDLVVVYFFFWDFILCRLSLILVIMMKVKYGCCFWIIMWSGLRSVCKFCYSFCFVVCLKLFDCFIIKD